MERKTPLVRRTPLKPGVEELRRNVEIRKRNAKRAAARFDDSFGSVARVRWVQMQPCLACGGWPSECAHVKSRGAGGKAEDTIPLCHACHAKQHNEGWSALPIEDPAAAAREIERRWQEVSCSR